MRARPRDSRKDRVALVVLHLDGLAGTGLGGLDQLLGRSGVGIENDGLYTSQDTTVALFNSLVQTCAWLCSAYGLDPHAAIVGHRDYVTTTECPGDVLYARLPELRDRVATVLSA